MALLPNALAEAYGLAAWTFDPGCTISPNVDTSGGVHACGVWLPHGRVITKMAMYVTSAAVAPTHYTLGIYDRAGNLVATTADAPNSLLATGWAELSLTAPYTTTYSGLYYFADLLAASTTMPSMLVSSTIGLAPRMTFPQGGPQRVLNMGVLNALGATIDPTNIANQSSRFGILIAR